MSRSRKSENSYIPEFDEVQDKVRTAVAGEMAKDVALAKTKGYLEAITEELNKTKLRDFPKAAKELGLEIYQTPIFNRGQYLPQVGNFKRISRGGICPDRREQNQ